MSEKESFLLDNEYIIMTEVSENIKVTQRDLSKKLGVSVSTVNILMNKMIREGLIKMTQVSQKQVLYMLTPVGIMEKTQKTVRYLKAHYRAFYETKEKIKSILDELNQTNDVIFVLMCSDEMNEILTIAVHEYKSKQKKSNIMMIYSIVDIDVKGYKTPILLYLTLNEELINEEIVNEYGDIKKIQAINIAERL